MTDPPTCCVTRFWEAVRQDSGRQDPMPVTYRRDRVPLPCETVPQIRWVPRRVVETASEPVPVPRRQIDWPCQCL